MSIKSFERLSSLERGSSFPQFRVEGDNGKTYEVALNEFGEHYFRSGKVAIRVIILGAPLCGPPYYVSRLDDSPDVSLAKEICHYYSDRKVQEWLEHWIDCAEKYWD